MRRGAWSVAVTGTLGFGAPSPAFAQSAPPGEEKAELRERAVLLAQVLPEAVRARSQPFLPVMVGAAGVLEGAVGVAGKLPLAVTAGSVAVGGAVGFYAVSERRNYELLMATSAASTGLFYLAFPLDSPHTRWQYPIAGAWLATSALGFVNFAFSTNPGRTRLARDVLRVRTPAARSSLSAAELRRIEQDLYDSDFYLPQWTLGLPLIVGGVVAAAPVFDGDVAPRNKPIVGLMAGATALTGVAISLAETPAARYGSLLERAGLHVKWGVGPGGVSVAGTFD
jgi:hypothetical protein